MIFNVNCREFRFYISKNLIGRRLDFILTFLFFQFSRRTLTNFILNGYCKINGLINTYCHKIITIECFISIYIELSKKCVWSAQTGYFTIIYEDCDLLVIVKKYNSLVHPTYKDFEFSLINVLLNYFPFLSNIPRAGIVHRLDFCSSGLLVIAKTLFAYYNFLIQFHQKNIFKFYEAISSGCLNNADLINTFVFTRNNVMNVPRFIKSITVIRILKIFKFFTYLKLYPVTGKTHQLRRQLSLLKCPIVGDFAYGYRLCEEHFSLKFLINFCHDYNKIALHASSIIFLHPLYYRYVFFSINVSSDFLGLLKCLSY